jgi:glycosyltransferase involved in cell wall biosynthesis
MVDKNLNSTVPPKVSIVSISYNQEKYIEKALDSFVMQKADFGFEVVIADDCSTDRTQEIILRYAKKYPDIIKPIIRENNIGIQPNLIDALRHASGEYIALCEGDDYWTDVLKLQTQADFLDKNRTASLVFHPVKVFFDKGEESEYIYPTESDPDQFSAENLIRSNFIQTNSVMYRKQKYDSLVADMMPFDWYLHLFHAQYGKIGFINKVMSAYRRHEGGVWWGSNKKKDEFWIRYGLVHLRTLDEIDSMYGMNKKDKLAINEAASRIYDALLDLSVDDRTNEIKAKSIWEHPRLVMGAYLSYSQRFKDVQNYASKQESDISDLHRTIKDKDRYIHDLENQIRSIHDTILWRTMRKLYRYAEKMRVKK